MKKVILSVLGIGSTLLGLLMILGFVIEMKEGNSEYSFWFDILTVSILGGLPLITGIFLLFMAIKKTKKNKLEKLIADPMKEMVFATTKQRFCNFFFDSLFSFIFIFVCTLILNLIGLEEELKGITNFLLAYLFVIIYYVPQEAIMGKTFGKMLSATIVVNRDGTKLTLWKSLIRTLCRLIPFEPFSYLGGNGTPMGWHDQISKTCVISTKWT